MSKSKNNQNKIINRLVNYAQRFRLNFILALILMLVSGVINILPSWVIKLAVDGLSALNLGIDSIEIFPTQVKDKLISISNNLVGINFDISNWRIPTSELYIYLPLVIIIVYLLEACLKFSYFYLIRLWGLRVVKLIREDFHSALLRTSLKVIHQKNNADYASIASSDMVNLQNWLAEISTSVFNDGFKAFALFVWLLIINTKLTLISIISLPVLAIPIVVIGKKIRKYTKSGQEHISKVLSFFVESVSNITIIKVFNLEKWRDSNFYKQSDSLFSKQNKWTLYTALVSPITNILAAIGISSILYFGLKSVNENMISLGDFSSYFVTSILLFDPIKRLGRITGTYQALIAVCERIFDLIDLEKEPDIVETINVDKSGCLKVDDLNFAYSDKLVLTDINLDLSLNQKIAFVGPSGGGKTTLVSILSGLYLPSSGSITYGSYKLDSLSQVAWRQNFAYVGQDAQLFNGSIKDNLNLNIELNLAKNDIFRNLNLASLETYANNEGLNYQIGELGANLSHGQKQRLNLARAFRFERPIVILDEPTSALDNKTQSVILNSIDKLAENSTVMIIAHRLETVKNCDMLFYIENGQVIESGKPSELLKNSNSRYSQFLSNSV